VGSRTWRSAARIKPNRNIGYSQRPPRKSMSARHESRHVTTPQVKSCHRVSQRVTAVSRVRRSHTEQEHWVLPTAPAEVNVCTPRVTSCHDTAGQIMSPQVTACHRSEGVTPRGDIGTPSGRRGSRCLMTHHTKRSQHVTACHHHRTSRRVPRCRR
jgi:hypothetical protein